MRILFVAFDHLLPPERREVNKGAAAFIPPQLKPEIDMLNAWVYDTVNNGVYKVGFAATQTTYDEHVTKLFRSLDRLEYHLSQVSDAYFGDTALEVIPNSFFSDRSLPVPLRSIPY